MDSQAPTAKPAPLLSLVAAVLLYLLVALPMDMHAPGQGGTHLFLPAQGMALALVLVGGRPYAHAVAAGALLFGALAGFAPAVTLAHAVGVVVAATMGSHLVLRQGRFHPDQPRLYAARDILLWACGVGCGLGALAASAVLWLLEGAAHHLGATDFFQWWMGSALGCLLVLPLALSYRRTLRTPITTPRNLEALLVWLLAAGAAYFIFGTTQVLWLVPLANAYWLFLFVTWAVLRLSIPATTGLLCLVALQALWGSYQHQGFFAHDIELSNGLGYWSYMVILGMTGLSLAAYVAEVQRNSTALRVAATAFECQEGLLITDAQGRIEQTNASAQRLTGYRAEQLQGHTPYFLAPHTPHFSSQAPLTFTPQHAAQHRLRLQRSDGTVFPTWLTISPVAQDGAQGIGHYVISMTDITSLEEQEAYRQRHEAALRHALVREVHHRIQNNLQGIVGMLRQLGRAHPPLHGPIQQVVDQIHSIATLHGLQTRLPSESVRLCDLARAIAEGIAQNWSRLWRWTFPPAGSLGCWPAPKRCRWRWCSTSSSSTPSSTAARQGRMCGWRCTAPLGPSRCRCWSPTLAGGLLRRCPPRGHPRAVAWIWWLRSCRAKAPAWRAVKRATAPWWNWPYPPPLCKQRTLSMSEPHTPALPHVLLVDDDRLILATLARGLQEAGFGVSTAESSEEAQELLTSGLRPDLALLDVRLPGEDGLALAARLRDLDQVPFLMLSAFSDDATVQEAARLGALGYLVKPLDTDQIRPTLLAAWQRAQERAELRQARDQLQTALNNDRDINVAIGITMVQYRLSRKAAFEMLRAAARAQRRKLASLAQEVIETCDKLHPQF